MTEKTYYDFEGETIVLTDAARDSILAKNPAAFVDLVPDVLADPDEVRRGDGRIVSYCQFAPDVLDGKWLVVDVRLNERNLVAELHVIDRVETGDLLWSRCTCTSTRKRTCYACQSIRQARLARGK